MDTILKLEDVSLFIEKNTILENINLEIEKGINWAIIGKNGSGKSFLLKVISTYQYPSQGKVTIMGHKLGETNVWELRKKIGIVSEELQKEYKENSTVFNVILSGFFSSIGIYEKPNDQMLKRTEKIIDILDLNHIKNKIFGRISYGEQKRVLIARALVFNPHLLILDEPTSGLDIASKEEFLKYVEKIIKQGNTIVYVTHHIDEILPDIKNVLVLKNGKILIKGKKEKILNSKILTKSFDVNIKCKKVKNRYFLNIKL